jgi:hypothetical protein
MPYDQFLVDQLAGDLLPNPTQSDLIATGFLRNSMTNAEAGTDPEQFRNEALYDRMDAIGKSVLGLTLQCAQCHTHKYDPLTHTEYFQLFAFLNNCHEKNITVYSEEDEQQREQVLADIRKVEVELQGATPDWQARLAACEARVRNGESTSSRSGRLCGRRSIPAAGRSTICRKMARCWRLATHRRRSPPSSRWT